MILQIKVPQRLFLYSFSKDAFETLSLSFSFDHYKVALALEGGDVEKATWAKPGDLCQWYREATSLVTTIAETEHSSHTIADLITAPRYEDLQKLIEGVTLKILRVIRNVGYAPELPESLPRQKTVVEDLKLWKPTVSEDGLTWTPVPFPAEPSLGLHSLFGFGDRGGFALNAELNLSYWPRITEVLEDNLEIPAEDEFLTNTIGHLRGRNFRLALVDAVIGLEIVLVRYLRAYLKIEKSYPISE